MSVCFFFLHFYFPFHFFFFFSFSMYIRVRTIFFSFFFSFPFFFLLCQWGRMVFLCFLFNILGWGVYSAFGVVWGFGILLIVRTGRW